MKTGRLAVLVAVLVAVLGSTAMAQSLEDKRDKKLAEEWVSNATWITNYDEAKAESKKSGKPIFAYFTRSYAY